MPLPLAPRLCWACHQPCATRTSITDPTVPWPGQAAGTRLGMWRQAAWPPLSHPYSRSARGAPKSTRGGTGRPPSQEGERALSSSVPSLGHAGPQWGSEGVSHHGTAARQTWGPVWPLDFPPKPVGGLAGWVGEKL